jgi:hypothetical protein
LQAAHFSNQHAALIGQTDELAALIIKATVKVCSSPISGKV